MTEVPEHLFQRSRDRRAALGLGGGEAGAPAAGSDEGSTPAGAAAASQVEALEPPVTAGSPDVAGTSTVPAIAPLDQPKPLAPYVVAAKTRSTIPRWAVPVLAGLPVWAIVYAGVLTVPDVGLTDPVLIEGEEIYSANCSGCHGGGGEGGTGRALSGGAVIATFPTGADHVAWVVNGSPAAGTPYGDPARPGGQRISQEDPWGAMPAFGELLTEEQLIAVVRYEREVLGGEATDTFAAAGEAGAEGEEAGTGAAGAPVADVGSEGGNVGGEGGDGDPVRATPGGGDTEDDEDLAGGSDEEGGPSGGDSGSSDGPSAEDTAGSGAGEDGEPQGGSGAGGATGGTPNEAGPNDAG